MAECIPVQFVGAMRPITTNEETIKGVLLAKEFICESCMPHQSTKESNRSPIDSGTENVPKSFMRDSKKSSKVSVLSAENRKGGSCELTTATKPVNSGGSYVTSVT